MGRHRGERGCKGRDVAGEREAVEEREDVEESEAVKVIGREFFHLLILDLQLRSATRFSGPVLRLGSAT